MRVLWYTIFVMEKERYNHLNKLPYDVIIVDEVSMVDSQLMYFLVRSIKRGAKLVLVGDKDQLASVGAGNVLGDILESECFAVSRLTQIYRQSEDSLIILNAHEINNGKVPAMDNKSRDFFFERKENNEEVLQSIIDMCTTRIPNYMGIDSSNIQVLAPMKSGVIGIDNTNSSLQDRLNPSSLSNIHRFININRETFIKCNHEIIRRIRHFKIIVQRRSYADDIVYT